MGPSTILYSRMWTFLFLYILGINFCQADNSTQMLYAKLIIDKSATENITSMLKSFTYNNTVVEAPVMTTVCTNGTGSKECGCKPGYRWNDTFCQSNLKCCGNANCTLDKSADAKCVSNTAVTITGSLTLQGSKYVDCLKDITDPTYAECSDGLLTRMKKVYSTLRGFDFLDITRFRIGSVIADFKIIIASSIDSQALINNSIKIGQILSASLNMETSGLVNLEMPLMPVPYGATNQVIRCTTKEDLKTDPQWRIINSKGQYDITTGTVSTVDMSSRTNSTVNLRNVTELWNGEYSCIYHQTGNCTTSGCAVNIFNKASAQLDVALLPNIDVFTEPSFPHCKTENDILQAKAKCEINNSTEPYNVTCDGKRQLATQSGNILVYTTSKIIRCDDKTSEYTTVCTFTNRLGNVSNAKVLFNIIFAKDDYCAAEGDWEDTKANFTAVLKCTNSAGQRTRQCNLKGIWGKEESRCVNFNLYDILQNAKISGTGLGALDKNAESIFSDLTNATQNPLTINTFPNLKASVEVISTMSTILANHSVNDTTTSNHFLASSSNLLDKSLENSWNPQNTESNQNLAEKYLKSVEKLIEISNISNGSDQTNLHVQTCSEDECTNTVFNASVTVQSSGNGIVKTAGFKYLQDYLPNTTNTSNINSIVVSTTTTERGKENLQITIKFPLLTPRPRDVGLQCVSWNYNQSNWTAEGCSWGGASKPDECTCNHLTSFAILMSRYPIEIPYMTEITYAGLSASVVSLVISLLIELIVWSKVVKTNTLHLRHTAHVNISLCLLVADCCFLASSKPESISEIWCRISALLKHFCYLAMFFWMLSLSTTLLHQAVFLFHKVGKKTYLRFSLILGYVCPFLIVFITFLTNNGGAQDAYFSMKTCWLVYSGILKGTIYTFILPVGIIVFINLFAMLVVIMKLLDHRSREKSHEKEIQAAKTVLRSVILLTPIFGLPWIFGFATFILDLTAGAVTFAVNYAFVLLNAFQGLLILLTTCLGDRMTREALLDSFRKNAPPTISESSTKLESTTKKS
ncbi:adhesion G protein-coupled receptor F5-like isoform X1 [Oreochromis aureus]|uniref:adhesion G protein-coupled receptor F5-like isoform X1 n=1 Tax=Oreochromis aureus TaxID=47969 RepID=UPI0019547A63|nr:adhesion G protein-coupled receptor F5-like isoform X1 [Oreochromis aureus]